MTNTVHTLDTVSPPVRLTNLRIDSIFQTMRNAPHEFHLGELIHDRTKGWFRFNGESFVKEKVVLDEKFKKLL